MMLGAEVLRNKTLLIVDDEPDLRDPLIAEFESLGCRVLEAGNGRDAFEIVKKEKVDAVISDIRMPNGDGIELLKNIKNLHHEFPIVMLITGFSDLSREEAYHLGAEAILSKPFDLDEIDETVIRILTSRESRWSCKTSPAKVKRRVECEFIELSQALDQGKLALGRGGLFLRLSEDYPYSGELISIQIRFHEGNIMLLDGVGVVRWVRREEIGGLPSGCGIEFENLSQETQAAVLEVSKTLQLKPYIPKY